MSENIENNCKQELKKYFWKGKRVTQKVYENRCRLQKVGKTIRSVYGIRNLQANLKPCDYKIEGRRIIHLQTLAEQLFCKKCKSILSLEDIVDEKRFGLASIFLVKCRNCLSCNQVSTDKQCTVSEQNQHYDVNTKVVVGTSNAEIDNIQLNKLLSSLNIPELDSNFHDQQEKEKEIKTETMEFVSCLKEENEETP